MSKEYVVCLRLGNEKPALVFNATGTSPEEVATSITEDIWATFWEQQGTYEADKDALCIWVQKYNPELHDEVLNQLTPT